MGNFVFIVQFGAWSTQGDGRSGRPPAATRSHLPPAGSTPLLLLQPEPPTFLHSPAYSANSHGGFPIFPFIFPSFGVETRSHIRVPASAFRSRNALLMCVLSLVMRDGTDLGSARIRAPPVRGGIHRPLFARKAAGQSHTLTLPSESLPYPA